MHRSEGSAFSRQIFLCFGYGGIIEIDSSIRDTYNALIAIGFGNNEARAYCALLAKSPANGYQVAQQSGIPKAKVYECLERLVSKGAAVRIESQKGNSRLFAPTDPNDLIDGIEKGLSMACKQAREALTKYWNNPNVIEVLLRVTTTQDLVARGKMLVEEANQSLHVALWAEEFDALAPFLKDAVDRDIELALVLYSHHPAADDLKKSCNGVIQHGRTKRQAIPLMGRQFVLVSDRKRCITGSVFESNTVEGVFTRNIGLVTNAVDLVNHEIYLERIVVEFGKSIETVFGKDLEKLDAFRPPAAMK